ncbi:hypothetical protein CROQUDRAFT_661589 [Cronartium quercuum f. sp. fusiforme G11]|uniref:Uncharacterized protein n=1 Tax=Cronartium quercuum f. sp. fusiforme G11 TaxID=708437 RepID=A0A9P6T938_9BASI|nr:hypothetical protein CROQUDRAFT_661589 [Cronartium quercuum f. sp. fusiforme G11]
MATSSSNQLRKLHSQLVKLSKSWPIDPLRAHQPELQLSRSIAQAADRLCASPSLYTDGQTTEMAQIEGASRVISSLQRLKDNEIAAKFPLSDKMRNPASFPNHYDELKAGVERAVRGETLPWYKRWFRSQ